MVVAYFTDDSEALAHYGVKGMKWGVRRYRNEDGSLTNAGKKRYLQAHSDAAYKDLKKNKCESSVRKYAETETNGR